jgi:hypothetical protein
VRLLDAGQFSDQFVIFSIGYLGVVKLEITPVVMCDQVAQLFSPLGGVVSHRQQGYPGPVTG